MWNNLIVKLVFSQNLSLLFLSGNIVSSLIQMCVQCDVPVSIYTTALLDGNYANHFRSLLFYYFVFYYFTILYERTSKSNITTQRDMVYFFSTYFGLGNSVRLSVTLSKWRVTLNFKVTPPITWLITCMWFQNPYIAKVMLAVAWP